jgi:hypothetical protein
LFCCPMVLSLLSKNQLNHGRSATIGLEEGWDTMQNAIKNILEGLPEPQITTDDYMILYTYVSIPDHIRLLILKPS